MLLVLFLKKYVKDVSAWIMSFAYLNIDKN